jgi:hypothetical protein
MVFCKCWLPPRLTSFVEALEKVPKEILGQDVERKDLTECATINDLMLGKGQVTPENIVLTRQKDLFYGLVRHGQTATFSGVSLTGRKY